MARLRLIAIIALASVLSASAMATNARADSVTTVTATGGQRKIDGSGTYAVSQGYTFVEVKFFAKNVTTGQTDSIAVTTIWGIWLGTLDLAAGTYDVWATLLTKNDTTMLDNPTPSTKKTNIVVP